MTSRSDCIETEERIRCWYEKTYGKLPKKVFILHECDNGKCRNPDHIFLGSQKDNIRDCVNKGRWKNNFPGRKLSSEQVKSILENLTISNWYWVKEFNVSWSTVNRVKKGKYAF